MPRLRISVAILRFSGNRPSKRYTKILVSTRAAAPVQVLSGPTPLPGAPRLSRRSTPAMPFCRLVEQTQQRSSILHHQGFARRDDVNHFSSGHPVDFITGTNLEAISDFSGYCNLNLILGRYFGHNPAVVHTVLTLARIISLFSRLTTLAQALAGDAFTHPSKEISLSALALNERCLFTVRRSFYSGLACTSHPTPPR
jgi:hypothetical protein